eukprot:1628478-Rhodomonas_salina.3
MVHVTAHVTAYFFFSCDRVFFRFRLLAETKSTEVNGSQRKSTEVNGSQRSVCSAREGASFARSVPGMWSR